MALRDRHASRLPFSYARAMLSTFRLCALLAIITLLASLSAGVLLAAVPELQVAVTDTSSTSTPGALLTYTVQARNTSASPLNNVRVRIQLSPNVTFVTASNSPNALGGGLYEWDVASLPAGSTTFRYVSVNVNSPLAQGTIITTNAAADQVGDTTANTATDTTIIEAAEVTLAPTSLTFGTQQVGTTSAGQQVILSNIGDQPLTISSIVASSGFGQTNTCPATLAPSANCAITVTFAPIAVGPVSGSLSVNDNAVGSPHTISLSGTGAQAAVTLAPTSLDFGSQRVGTSSTLQQVSVTNSGTASLSITSIAANGDYSLGAGTCAVGQSLPPNGSCTVAVIFTPSAVGARSGQLSIGSNAPGSPHAAPLTGNGIQPGIQLVPASLSFGNQALNTTSTAQQVTLTNSGTAPLAIASIFGGGDFAQTNTCPATLAPGLSCVIDVTFTPTILGPRSGQLTVNDDAPSNPHALNLSGTGLSAVVQISPASIDFGSLAVGATSAARTATITNTGNTGLTFTSIAASGDFAQTNTCPLSPATLAPSTSCAVSVTFTPTAMGTRGGQLTFTDSAPGGAQAIGLAGVGLQAALSINPASLDFGNQRLSTTSTSQQVLLSNTGNQGLLIASLSVAPAGEFTITSTTCSLSPTPLAAGASCTITSTFTPSATGARSATLTVNDDAPNAPHTLALGGTGVDPQATFSAVGLNFGNQQISTSATQTITLTSSGVGALTIGSIASSGDYAQTNTCPASLASGASCTIRVTFRPTASNARPGTLTVTSDAAASPHTLSLTGFGIQPVVSLDPTSLDFGSLAINTTSAPQVITLSNTGSQPLVLRGIGVSSNFAQTNSCPSSPTTLAPGASCTISVSFTPSAVGDTSGTLTISSNAPSSPHTLTLAGVGGGAVYTSTPASGTIRMSSLIGSSNTISITISNDGNQPLTITGPAESVAAPFSIAPAAGYTIQPNDVDQTVAVRCAPTSSAPFTQQLTYTTNDPSKQTVVYSVVCTGTTVTTAGYSSSPNAGSTWTVGTTSMGGSVSSDLVISESGTAALIVGLSGGSAATAISGPNASDFAITAPTNFAIAIADGGAPQQLTVRCQPSAVGTRAATLTLTTNDLGQPTVSYGLRCTGQAATTVQRLVYLPLVAQTTPVTQASQPDLTASVSVAPSSVVAGQPVKISVTITNQGNATASEFWADLYINPNAPPTASNQPWNQRCGLEPCYGIAWYVTQPVEPGQSITLTSQPESYYAKNTIWEGAFAAGTTDLYVYVDSWNPTVSAGAVVESNEANNRGELHGLRVGGSASIYPPGASASGLPERPLRPNR